MKIREIKCKTALSKSNLPGLDYSLNPYRGCQHNCAYCYVPNVLRINRDDWGEFVQVKTNIPNILAKELKKKTYGVVGISTVCDPYQAVEKKYRLTRYCLEQLLRYDFPICIQTKSDLVLRDIDIISKFTNAEIIISIGTLNDEERKILEPGASSISKRLELLEKLSDYNLKKTIFLGPIYPSLDSKKLNKLVKFCEKNSVSEIIVDKFNLKPGIKENIEQNIKGFEYLEEIFDGEDSYKQRLLFLKNLCKNNNIKVKKAF